MPRRKDGISCTATAKSTGTTCGNPPIHGGNVCRIHGGSAPQVQAVAARAVLEALIGPALTALRDIVKDLAAPEGVRLAAARDILDRTGFKPVEQMEITFEQAESRLDEEFEELVKQYEAMERAESEGSE